MQKSKPLGLANEYTIDLVRDTTPILKSQCPSKNMRTGTGKQTSMEFGVTLFIPQREFAQLFSPLRAHGFKSMARFPYHFLQERYVVMVQGYQSSGRNVEAMLLQRKSQCGLDNEAMMLSW